ncbi:MAG TPA: hypothetical protein ENJ18_03370 [Nannocystis exedens]|nr:hypothetical protein [Nannocystis exedens]
MIPQIFIVVPALASALLGLVPSERTGQDPSGIEAARDLFEGRDYLGAAASFDDLYAANPSVDLLHYAALSWASAGDDTRAILRWRRFFADKDAAASKYAAEAKSQLDEASKRTTALSIRAVPPGGLTAASELTLERLDGEAGAALVVKFAELQALGGQLAVAPGRWRIAVRGLHPGYEPSSAEVETDADLSTLEVTIVLTPVLGALQLVHIKPEPGAPVPGQIVFEDRAGIELPVVVSLDEPEIREELRIGRWSYTVKDRLGGIMNSGEVEMRAGSPSRIDVLAGTSTVVGDEGRDPADSSLRLRLGVGLGVAGVGLIAGGLAWYPYGQARDLDDFFAEGSTVSPQVVAGQHERLAEGLMLVGSGLGVGIGAASAAFGVNNRGLLVEAGVGGATFAGGLGLLLSGGPCLEKSPYGADNRGNEESIRACRARDIAGGLMLGSGLGLVGASSVTLLTRWIVKKRRRRQATTRADFGGGPGGLSLTISGRF